MIAVGKAVVREGRRQASQFVVEAAERPALPFPQAVMPLDKVWLSGSR